MERNLRLTREIPVNPICKIKLINLIHCRAYLKSEHFERKGLPFNNAKEISPAKYPDIPIQTNDRDCGVYLLHYAELIFQVKFCIYFSSRYQMLYFHDSNNYKSHIFLSRTPLSFSHPTCQTCPIGSRREK